MAIERKENVEILRDEGFERKQRVVEYAVSTRQVIVSRVSKLIGLITTVLVSLILFRFVLKLIAANPQNGFVDFVYNLTGIFVTPFEGIIGTYVFDNGGIVDLASLFAIVVYILASWAFVTLIYILFADSKRSRQVTTVSEEQ